MKTQKLRHLFPILLFLLAGFSSFSQNKNVTLLGQYPYTSSTLHGRVSDIWGHVDSAGNEYAIIGLQKGVSIVDVTNPSNLKEVFYVSGASSIWRDIKTWDDHAYITNETSGGLMIIDMSNLPGAITSSDVYSYGGNNYTFAAAHNLYIDEKGVAYIFGADYSNGGAIFLDVDTDPKVPVEVGIFDSLYFHDGMVRGDTLWGAAVFAGEFFAIDVATKSSPKIMASSFTSGFFAHNCWISDDGNTLFTTDEIRGGAIGSYDVSDLGNIDELDLIFSNPGSQVIPHNTHVFGDFLVTSYYRDGVQIVDVTQPDRMVEVGNYDTAPLLSGNGFNGCWGVYPYLPSGKVIASDIEEGLFVFDVNYTKGVYLEGNTRKFSDSSKLGITQITHVNTGQVWTSNLNGFYKESFPDSGWNTFAFFKPGYLRDTIDIYMKSGQLHTLDAYLRRVEDFTIKGSVSDAGVVSNAELEGAEVYLEGMNGLTYRATTDANGYFEIDSVFEGFYEVTVGKWTYESVCSNIPISKGDSLAFQISKAIEDDFTFSYPWSIINNGSNGFWERQYLKFSPYFFTLDFPIEDDGKDCADFAMVTGKSGLPDHDVDGGWNMLVSPVISTQEFDKYEPNVSFSYWFRNDAPTGSDDSLIVEMIRDAGDTIRLMTVHNAVNPIQAQWIDTSFILSQYAPGTTVQVIFRVGDFGNDDLLEVGIDHFRVSGKYVGISENKNEEEIFFFPNPFEERLFLGNIDDQNFLQYEVYQINGSRVFQGNLQGKNFIDFPESIRPGLYVVSLIDDQGNRLSKRVIRQ